MKDYLNHKTIEKEFELIAQSPQFKNAEKEIRILDYLIKKTLDKEHIKEAHIAIDIFNKDSDFDPALDSTVRVYIAKIRKKLEIFYLSEDSKDANVKLTIPKGSYKVAFGERIKKQRISRLKLINTFFIILSFVLFTAFLIYLINSKSGQFSHSNKVSKSAFWKEYTNSDLPTIIVVGDFFFMRKKTNNKVQYIRNPKINSSEELYAYGFDTLGYKAEKLTYTTTEMPECVTSLIPHMINNKEIFKVKPASKLTLEDIISNNIIFIGDFKTLHLLKKLLPKFNIEYNPVDRNYIFFDDAKNPGDKFNYRLDNEGYRKEHVVVCKRQGGNNNTHTLIMSLGRGGIDDVIQKLCNPEFLDDFVKKYRKKKSSLEFYFDIVFEMEGIEGASFDSEIVYFNQVD